MTERATTLLIVAGEASGDAHGARLVRALRARDPAVRIIAVGGEAMRAAGATIVHEMRELSVVGITEVARRLPAVLRVLLALKRRLQSGEIDLFVPVDFPDFNFRVARAAHAAGVPVYYFIAPQVWAWRTGRLKEMARWCRRIAVLFPFEVEIFERAGVPATHVAHPLLDEADLPVRDVRAQLDLDGGESLVALLPGSRSSEVERHLPVMAAAAARLTATRRISAAIGRAGTIDRVLLERLAPGMPIVDPPSRDLVRAADVVITASGTATLEVALAGTPMVVIYKLSTLTWFFARRLVRVEHVAMANLLAGERLVPELLQDEATPHTIAETTLRLLRDDARRAVVREGYQHVRAALLGGADLDAVAGEVLDLAAARVAS